MEISLIRGASAVVADAEMLFSLEVRGTHCRGSEAALRRVAVGVSAVETAAGGAALRWVMVEADCAVDAKEKVEEVLAGFGGLVVTMLEQFGSYRREARQPSWPSRAVVAAERRQALAVAKAVV